ncbi:hypothetical protein D3C87_1642250 [compost metagenome]
MQTTGNLISILVKFTTGVENCQYNLQSRFILFGVHSGGDTATVVFNGNGIIFLYRYIDGIAVTCHRLINGVVNNLPNQVVHPFEASVTDIHRRTFTNGL